MIEVISLRTRLTKTNVFGLLQGAVITLGVATDKDKLAHLKPGRTVRLSTEDEGRPQLECIILDFELRRQPSGAGLMPRLTLRHAGEVATS
jgi:hypothetical protein